VAAAAVAQAGTFVLMNRGGSAGAASTAVAGSGPTRHNRPAHLREQSRREVENMAHVPLVTRDDLSEPGQAAWDAEVVRSGADPTHMKRALLNHLPSYAALMHWYPLYGEVERLLDPRAAVVFSFAISTQNECLLCTTYFRRALRNRGEDINGLDLTEQEEDVAAFGRALARNDRSDRALVARLRERYGAEALVALVGFAILMIGNNLVNSFLDVELDPGLQDLSNELAAQARAELEQSEAAGRLPVGGVPA
jgi:alkylhydroperoxidase family enzyme